jgi:hypothetical protein
MFSLHFIQRIQNIFRAVDKTLERKGHSFGRCADYGLFSWILVIRDCTFNIIRPTILFVSYLGAFRHINVFFFSWGETESTWYCGHYWPIVPAPDDRWWLWSNRWNANWQGKPKYSEKTCPSATLSTTNPTWPDPCSNPGCRCGKSATNRLSYGAASHKRNFTLKGSSWRRMRNISLKARFRFMRSSLWRVFTVSQCPCLCASVVVPSQV